MAADAHLVTDRLIDLGYARGKPLTQLDVQKLLYFFEGWHLALVGDAAFAEDFEAWKNGPVIVEIYERLKRYGASLIPLGEVRSRDFATLGTLILDLIERVFDTYKAHDPGALVGLTHLPGTPWVQTRDSHGVRRGESSRVAIPKPVMRDWFLAVWHAALESASPEILHASPEEYADWAATAGAAA